MGPRILCVRNDANNPTRKRIVYLLPYIGFAFLVFVLNGVICPDGLALDNNNADFNRGALKGDRCRVIVSSDIGGLDNDDYQSMIHFLVYADRFDVEGIISSPPDAGRVKHIIEVIDAYAMDYKCLKKCSKHYPSPKRLRSIVKQGALDPSHDRTFNHPTDGSRWIIDRAKAHDIRPLYILVWGSITDIAQAVHDNPLIKEKIRIYSIGSWNTSRDRIARNYLFEEHTDLWWIESNSTFRGMYVGGHQDGGWGNKAFVDQYVKGHGSLGNLFAVKLDTLKMGDSPSLLYLLKGNPDDPSGLHWGGSFVRTDHGPHYWTDSADSRWNEGKYPGAKSVNVWREEYLCDWRNRMESLRQYIAKDAGSILRHSVQYDSLGCVR